MADIEARRDAQVDLEHTYYEDSGLADAHARKVAAFQTKLLSTLIPAATRQQRLLQGLEAAPSDLVAAGAPPGHSPDQYGSDPRTNLLALAILNQKQFENPSDAPVLRHCVALEVTPCEAPKVEPEAPMGIRVTLRFSKNEFFSNEIVERTFGFATTAADDIDVVSADDGTQIHWHPGKDATVRLQKRTGTMRNAAPVKVPVMSIFRLFTKDGLKDFGPMNVSMLSAIKPLIEVAVFTVHIATGTRTHGSIDSMAEGPEGDDDDEA